jgi:hypothetical protein
MRDVTIISHDLLAVIDRQFQRNKFEHSNVSTDGCIRVEQHQTWSGPQGLCDRMTFHVMVNVDLVYTTVEIILEDNRDNPDMKV